MLEQVLLLTSYGHLYSLGVRGTISFHHPALWVGFIMLMVTPCTDWYLIFTEIAKGNVALSTAILPVNLILQVLLLPIYLFLFAGVMKTVAISVLVESIVIVIVLPFILAHATKFIMNKMKKLNLSRINSFRFQLCSNCIFKFSNSSDVCITR